MLTLDEALRIALAYHPAVAQARQALAAAAAQVRAGPGRLPAQRTPRRRLRPRHRERGQRRREQRARATRTAPRSTLDCCSTISARRRPWSARPCARQLAAEERPARRRATTRPSACARRSSTCARPQELLQVAEEAVRQYQAHLDQVRAFAEVGTRTRYDVTKAEVDLGNARAGPDQRAQRRGRRRGPR